MASKPARCRGGHCHPRAEHGQDGAFASSAMERGPVNANTDRCRPSGTRDAIEGLAERALMEQAPGRPARAIAGNQHADQQCDRHVGLT